MTLLKSKRSAGGIMHKKVLAGVLTTALVMGNLALPANVSLGGFDFGALSAQATETVDSGTCGENLTWVLDEDGVLTISGSGEMEDYESGGAPWYRYSNSIIDGNIGGIKTIVIETGVTSIGEYAFEWCMGIEYIAIPEGVSVICESAFESCMNLRCVEIPVSVTQIEHNAFLSCKFLDTVYYWGSEEDWDNIEIASDYINPILEQARIYYNFDEDMRIDLSEYSGTCGENLTWVLDDGVLTISGSGDMEDYDSSEDIPWHDYINHIETVVIEDGVTNIASEAFYGSTTLTSVNIPDSVTSIGDSAFGECSSLSAVYYSSEDDWNEIDIGDGNDSLVSATFHFDEASKKTGTCGENLTWALDDGVLTISGSGDMDDFESSDKVPWYDYRKYIESIVIEDGVTSIGNYSFYGCSNVTSVEISDSVTSIGGQAFYGCSSLTSIEIPAGVTTIEHGAFWNCKSLTSIEIPVGVTTIEYDTFSGCSSLTSIEIPNSVTSIGSLAFYGCGSLINIEIPDSVTSIKNQAFYGCSSLTSIEIPDSVASIENQAFRGCKGLADDEGFVIIKDILFGYYGDNASVVIPSGVTNIDDYAFYGCSSLTNVEMPDSVTTIGTMAFGDCTSLTSINIPDSVTTIGYKAFCGCTSLTSINIPDSVTNIIGAFKGCEGLADEDGFVIVKDIMFDYYGDNTSVDIPSGVTRIGEEAFLDCSDLTSVKIPNSVTCIGMSAFSGCSNLTSVDIPDSVTKIESFAFGNCSSLISVDIPISVTYIGYSAFDGCEGLLDVNYAGSESKWNKINDATFSESTTIHFTESSYEDGDANLDGSVDYLDAMTVLRADAELIELTDEQLSAADVNGDGSVDSLDAILILRYDAGLIESF